MNCKNVNLVYFSATSTTKQVLDFIALGIGKNNTITYDITQGQSDEVVFGDEDIVIFGFPVYSGRIPRIAAEHLQKFKGNKTPASIVCVYGNRDYDDALLELRDIVSANNFSIILAGAFIGQHSIFPATGKNRPDVEDKNKAITFGSETIDLVEKIVDLDRISAIKVKGDFPYKVPKSIPLTPKGNKSCDKCGKCVRKCPTLAIDKATPRKTNKNLCIACGRCIYVCPQQARKFGGIIYKIASKKFTKAYSERKESETIFVL